MHKSEFFGNRNEVVCTLATEVTNQESNLWTDDLFENVVKE